MKVLYIVNLNNYYSEHFNTFYTKKLVIDKDNIVRTTIDKFSGYLDYELFNKEDEARVHREVRESLQGDLDKIIYDTDLTNNVTKAMKIIEENKCIETINLKDTIHKVKEHDFILSVSVSH